MGGNICSVEFRRPFVRNLCKNRSLSFVRAYIFMNHLLCFSGIIDKENLKGVVPLHPFEDEVSPFCDFIKGSGKMGVVLKTAKLAHMTNKCLFDGLIEEKLLCDNVAKTFLNLFAFKHFQVASFSIYSGPP